MFQEDHHALAEVFTRGSKLCQRSNGCSSDGGRFKEDAVVDEPDVLVGLGGAWPLPPKEVENADGQLNVLAVFNELTQVRQTYKSTVYEK